MLFYLRYVNIILKTKTHINKYEKKEKKRCGDTLSLKSTSDQTGTTSPQPNRLSGPYEAESQTTSCYTSSRKKGQRNLQVLQLSLGGRGPTSALRWLFQSLLFPWRLNFLGIPQLVQLIEQLYIQVVPLNYEWLLLWELLYFIFYDWTAGSD